MLQREHVLSWTSKAQLYKTASVQDRQEDTTIVMALLSHSSQPQSYSYNTGQLYSESLLPGQVSSIYSKRALDMLLTFRLIYREVK